MKLQELLEYETKSGDEITFQRLEDDEGDENRGWIVHRINAYLGNQDDEVGYLKIAYIPTARFKKHYPSIFNYADRIKGWGLMWDLGGKDLQWEELQWQKFNKSDKVKLLKNVIQRVGSISWNQIEPTKAKVDGLSVKELDMRIRAYERRMMKQYGKQFRDFRAHHVDKPVIDYIKVDPDLRRKRIGIALYQEGAKWMREKGLKLHASGTQSDEAQAAWKFMGRKMDVRKTRYKRRYLNVA